MSCEDRLHADAPRGVVVGKFLPFHAGHRFLIDRAITQMRDLGGSVDVVVADRQGEVPSASVRARWVRELCPAARVVVVADVCAWHDDDPCPPGCSAVWSEHLAACGLGPYDRVFGSDRYIQAFASELGATPVLVDEERVAVPAHGRVIRRDVASSWDLLDRVVRADLVSRVVVLGAESTGTTTLAGDLAEALGTLWVREFGREWSERRACEEGSIWDVSWSSADFDQIASGQEALESAAVTEVASGPLMGSARRWGPLVVCDTDVLATYVWHRRYVGADNSRLLARALARPPVLYVLASHEGVEFAQDGLRDGEGIRQEMTGWFEEVLASQPAPWLVATGDRAARVAMVLEWLGAHRSLPVATATERARLISQ